MKAAARKRRGPHHTARRGCDTVAAKSRSSLDKASGGLSARLAAGILAARVARGFTQGEAAAKAGMVLRVWQKVEAGEANAKLTTLHRVALAFDIDPLKLFTAPPKRGEGGAR